MLHYVMVVILSPEIKPGGRPQGGRMQRCGPRSVLRDGGALRAHVKEATMRETEQRRRGFGFTLIELLVVIFIIGALSALTMPYLSRGQGETNKARAVAMVRALDLGLEMFYDEHGFMPGREAPAGAEGEESNVISQVVAALNGAYMRISEKDLAVMEDGTPRPPTRRELDDTAVPKVILDPWGAPYVARENKSRERKEPWMRNKDFMDVYSTGRNMIDDTLLMTPAAENDDIGNW